MEKPLISRFPFPLKRGHRIILVVTLLVTVLAFGVASHPPVAHAASNGQMIAVVTYDNSVFITGYNPSGYSVGICLNTPSIPPQWSDNVTWNYWWIDHAHVDSYSASGCQGASSGYMNCAVPINAAWPYFVFNFTNGSCYMDYWHG